MTMCFFSINKDESLEIIRSIMASTPLQEPTIDEDEDEDDWPSPPLYQHKLAIVELYVDTTETLCIENYYTGIITKSHKERKIGYDWSDKIDSKEFMIHDGTKIGMDAFLHKTRAGCDWSYATFSYDDYLQTWIIKEDSWGAEKGVTADGCVTMLDFSVSLSVYSNGPNKLPPHLRTDLLPHLILLI